MQNININKNDDNLVDKNSQLKRLCQQYASHTGYKFLLYLIILLRSNKEKVSQLQNIYIFQYNIFTLIHLLIHKKSQNTLENKSGIETRIGCRCVGQVFT